MHYHVKDSDDRTVAVWLTFAMCEPDMARGRRVVLCDRYVVHCTYKTLTPERHQVLDRKYGMTVARER